MEELSFRWFSLYYLALGALLVTGGVYILTRVQFVSSWIIGSASHDKPPSLMVKTVKYLLIFTIPCLVLAFFPLSWPELIFSLWCFIVVYTSGQMLFHWKHTAEAIRKNREQVPRKIKFIAANMLSIGVIMFLLYYNLHTRMGS